MGRYEWFCIGLLAGASVAIVTLVATGDTSGHERDRWACANAYAVAATEADTLRLQLHGCPPPAEIKVPTLGGNDDGS